jgi:hypothetical protein
MFCFSCIAQVSSEAFAPYYSHFMPGIRSVLVAATAPDQAVLRGKAMECAGLVGDAVGVEIFARDAMEIMQLFIHAIVSKSIQLFDHHTHSSLLPLLAPRHGTGHHI